MKKFFRIILIAFLLFFSVGALGTFPLAAQDSPSNSTDVYESLKAFAAFNPIDVHVHVFKHDPAFQALLEKANLKVLNILVVDDTLPYRKELKTQVSDALALVRASKGRVALCTTFDP